MNLKTRDLILIAMFAALTAIGAFIRIPLPVVPITLQYFFCALGALLLGAKKGALAQILYVAVGLIGIPIFTKGGGPQYIFQPSFGYLIRIYIWSIYNRKVLRKTQGTNNKKCIYIMYNRTFSNIFIWLYSHVYTF